MKLTWLIHQCQTLAHLIISNYQIQLMGKVTFG